MSGAPVGSAKQFIGHWKNEDPGTSGITQVKIRSDSDMILVHMWDKRQPEDHDWGEEKTILSDAYDGTLSITWTPSFKIETQQLTVLPDEQLKVVGHRHFVDGSERPDSTYVEFFVKQ